MNKFNKIIITVSSETYEMLIEDYFTDPYMEACSRVVEMKRKNEKSLSLPPFLFAQTNRKNAKIFVYNSYVVLINCGLHKQAENLRLIFKQDSGVDLKKEPIHSK